MQTQDKFNLWTSLLLLWNGGLLIIVIILLLVSRPKSVDTEFIADECAAQAQTAVQAQCPQP